MDKIFSIIKISYNLGHTRIQYGSCGTCFFINKQEFVTAEHCFNETSFQPNPGLDHYKIFLAGENGKIILDPQIKNSYKDYDLAIGRVTEEVAYFSSDDFLEDKFLPGDEVFNIGFPEQETIRNFNYQFLNGRLIINNIVVESQKQKGKIDEIKKETYDRPNDRIRIVNKTLIILNYTSYTGFSGGPLFYKNTNQIIGFMSLLPHGHSIPINLRDRDVKNRVRAVPLFEIKHLL